MSSDGHIVLFRRAPAELNRRKLERFAQALCEEVSAGAGFTCLITGDRELRRLNRDFLGKDYATDVLSFPESGNQGAAPDSGREGTGCLGELAISIARARAQAAEHHHSLETEICILMLHGVLHLKGMNHESDRGRMARAETRWRRRLGLPAGLIERVRA